MEVCLYGELSIIGYNGRLTKGNRGRKRSKFKLCKRENPNGIKKSKKYHIDSQNLSQALLRVKSYFMKYAISETKVAVVEYEEDPDTDMFQIGRSSAATNDFVIMEKPPAATEELKSSTVSRFACRILVNRNNPKIVEVYAGGFNTDKGIFLGMKAFKWVDGGVRIDGHTTNKVLITHPEGSFCGGEAKYNLWMGISIEGQTYTIDGSRWAQPKGHLTGDKRNTLRDGSLINLGDVTLLFRSAEGLSKSPTQEDLENMVDQVNDIRTELIVPNTLDEQCEVSSEENRQFQPHIYLNCGHIQMLHNLSGHKDAKHIKCPLCSTLGPVAKMCIGSESSFYVDFGPLTHVFNPCGHMTTEKTVKLWSQMSVPHGVNDFLSVCPFCAMPLMGSPGYIKMTPQNEGVLSDCEVADSHEEEGCSDDESAEETNDLAASDHESLAVVPACVSNAAPVVSTSASVGDSQVLLSTTLKPNIIEEVLEV